MRIRSLLLIATLVTPTVPAAMTAFANEGKEKVVKLDDIPAPARQTILREALLVADHNAYHIGQLVMLRKSIGM